MFARALSLFTMATLASGCGSLVDRDYLGEVLFEIEGTVETNGHDIEGDVGVALLWSAWDAPVQGSQSVRVETSFPARYRIQVFRPPDEDATFEFFGDQEMGAAVADIVLFQDVDGDGDWDPEREDVVGGSFDTSVIWLPDDADLDSESGWSPDPGFNVAWRNDHFSCLEPWQDWLAEPYEDSVPLEVGYFFPANFDWNCDGAGEWDQWFDDDPWFESCDEGAFESECAFFEETVEFHADEEALVAELAALLEDPYYQQCMAEVCPEVIEEILEAAGPW